MSSLVANTITFEHIYLAATGNCVGPMEMAGPLGHLFDHHIDDLYGSESSFEKAERYLATSAIGSCLNKVSLSKEQLDLAVGGDLLNQITTANFVARDIGCPFIGVYSACSTSALALYTAACHVESGMQRVIAFTSSHQATAERQYRYPLEYGIQKKPATTYTATGAGAFLLQDQPARIRLSRATIGRVIDYGLKDANDMGSAMAPAAYHVIRDHFKNTQTGPDDYDLIVTGDLSSFGLEMLHQLFLADGMHIKQLQDCGLLLYDTTRQPVFQGGSGCACSALVLSAFLLDRLRTGQFKRILYVPTGALLSPTSINQKETIPCISHVIEWEAIQ